MMRESTVLLSLLLGAGCQTAPASPAGTDGGAAPDLAAGTAPDLAERLNLPGTHVHSIEAGGIGRSFIVYVPEKARGAAPAPAVLMFHGTSGDGERFYNISGWREKADETGLLAVFPTALVHCFHEDENFDGDFADPGEDKVTTKWAAGKLGDKARMPLCTPAEIAKLGAAQRAQADHPLADDIAFVRGILDLLGSRYVVDAKRVYASGFSNGAAMTSRLAMEMSDRFAAVAAAAGLLNLAPRPAARPLSLVFSVGNEDDRFLERTGFQRLAVEEAVLTKYPPLKNGGITPYLQVLQLKDSYVYDEKMAGGKKIARFTYAQSAVGAANSFQFVLVEGLAHQYPNGQNHPLSAANALWEVFRGQSLP